MYIHEVTAAVESPGYPEMGLDKILRDLTYVVNKYTWYSFVVCCLNSVPHPDGNGVAIAVQPQSLYNPSRCTYI